MTLAQASVEFTIADFVITPVIVAAIGAAVVAIFLFIGILYLAVRAGSSDASTAGSTSDGVDDVGAEAARRLQQEGEDITPERFAERLSEVKRDQKRDGEHRADLLMDADRKQEIERLAVAPELLVETADHVRRRGDQGIERYARTLIVASYPGNVAPGWLDALFSTGLSTADAEVRVSFQIWPRDLDKTKRTLDVRATRLTAQIRRKKSEGKLDTIEEEQQLEHVERLRTGITEGSTRLFDFGLYFEVLAKDEETLEEATKELKQHLAQSNTAVTTLYDRQREAQRSMAPIADDPVRNTQIMDLDALATTFPFMDPTVVQPTGVLMGFHMATNAPIVVDRFSQSGHNMLISGKIGSGKSYLAKLSMWRRLMIDPETEVLIIDPVGGFDNIVDAVDGQRVTIDNRTTINPLEITATGDAEVIAGDPYDDKIRSVMGLFEAHFEGRRELSKEEEGVLRRAVRYAYLEQGITKDASTHHRQSPTIGDVLRMLDQMAGGRPATEFLDVPSAVASEITTIESETLDVQQHAARIADYAQSVLLGLEDFTEGGQRSNLNGQTTVSLDDRVVQFDLSAVADGSNEGLIMQIVLDWLFQRAKAADENMVVMIDEAHYMLGHDQALDMLNLFARHSRHYGSGLTLISQTVDEFMTDPRAKEIYDQCDIRVLMRHQDIGDQALDALGLTERERDFVLQAQAGNSADYSEGLLYVSDAGTMRMRVLSNDFEHHIVDGDLNPWAFLYDTGTVSWDAIPPDQREAVRRILDVSPGEQEAAG